MIIVPATGKFGVDAVRITPAMAAIVVVYGRNKSTLSAL